MNLGREPLTHRQVASLILIHRDAMARAAYLLSGGGGGTSAMSHDGKKASREQQRRLALINAAKTPDDFAKLYTKANLTEVGENGGIDLDRAEKARIALAEVKASQSEIEFATNKQKWQERPPCPPTLDASDLIFDEEVGAPMLPGTNVPDPEYLKCSYGHEPHWVHRSQATHGAGRQFEKAIYETIYINGERVTTKRWIKWREQLVACPDHCLNIDDTRFPLKRE